MNHFGERRILKEENRGAEGFRVRPPGLLLLLLAVAFREVKEDPRVTVRRIIHHDKLILGFTEHPGDRGEHRDFLGAGRLEVFFKERAARGVEPRSLRFHHVRPVFFRLILGVNPGDREIGERAVKRFLNVGRRVTGREMDFVPERREARRDRGRYRGFADTAFPKHHDETVAGGRDFVHEIGERPRGRRIKFDILSRLPVIPKE